MSDSKLTQDQAAEQDDYQAAFQQFMLTGKKKQSSSKSATEMSISEGINTPSSSNRKKKKKKTPNRSSTQQEIASSSSHPSRHEFPPSKALTPPFRTPNFKSNYPSTPTTTPVNQTPRSLYSELDDIASTTSTGQKQVDKNFSRSIAAFQKQFVTEWLDTDDYLCQVVQSIEDLRQRLKMISGRLSTVVSSFDSHDLKQPNQQQENKEHNDWWKQCGYRGTLSGTAFTSQSKQDLLNRQDLEQSLSHTLLAHERMLKALRQGLSQLQEAQEGLGRRLEPVMTSMTTAASQLPTNAAFSANATNTVPLLDDGEECVELFRAAAEDLYRKQLLGQELWLETCTDALLGFRMHSSSLLESNNIINVGGTRSMQSAAHEWKRTHSSNPLRPFQFCIERMQTKFSSKN